MTFAVTILADSVADYASSPSRLTTFELTYPRCIHSEFMTHRVFSRNSASSRAIPVEKMIRDVEENPFIPISWGKNQRGMSAREELDEKEADHALELWLQARDRAVDSALRMIEIGLHKQIINRILEPWMWITVICTGHTFKNFFLQRCHEDAEPHMQRLAGMMREAYEASKPTVKDQGEWHLPFITDQDIRTYRLAARAPGASAWDDEMALVKKSVARCARGSYLQQHGNFTMAKDIELHDLLAEKRHWSPFEHQAVNDRAKWISASFPLGNLATTGWVQYRKTFAGESGCDDE